MCECYDGYYMNLLKTCKTIEDCKHWTTPYTSGM